MSVFEFRQIGTELPAAPEATYISPAVVPPFARKIGSLASEIGFANAVTEVFADANIGLEVDGDLSQTVDQGLIIAGDHSQRIEPLLVQAAMSKSGRDASRVIAMPTSFAGKLMQTTELGRDLIIPVIPTRWAAENKFSLNEPRRMLRRAMHPDVLNQPRASLQRLNAEAITEASEYVAEGGAVTIFPTGNSIELPWRNGVGNIVGALPEEARADTQVVAFRPEPFSVKRVMSSLLLRDMGIRPKKQTIVLGIHTLGSVDELLTDVQQPDAAQTTELIRAHYLSQL
jgi:hypothetical protein